MWVLKRIEDGKYVAKEFSPYSYTRSLMMARKFDTLEQAVSNSCVENEIPVKIDPLEYFK